MLSTPFLEVTVEQNVIYHLKLTRNDTSWVLVDVIKPAFILKSGNMMGCCALLDSSSITERDQLMGTDSPLPGQHVSTSRREKSLNWISPCWFQQDLFLLRTRTSLSCWIRIQVRIRFITERKIKTRKCEKFHQSFHVSRHHMLCLVPSEEVCCLLCQMFSSGSFSALLLSEKVLILSPRLESPVWSSLRSKSSVWDFIIRIFIL